MTDVFGAEAPPIPRGDAPETPTERAETFLELRAVGGREVVRFAVNGKPKPAGSKHARPVMRKDQATGRSVPVFDERGRPKVINTDSGDKSGGKEFTSLVHDTGQEAMLAAGEEPLFDEPIRVRFVFFRKRPDSHFGTGRNRGVLKPSAPAFPVKRPDVLKLSRRVEDALTGVVWEDDSAIVVEELFEVYGPRDRVEVTVWSLEDVRVGMGEPPADGLGF